MSKFTESQINNTQTMCSRNSEYGVTIKGLHKMIVGIGKTPSKSGKWGKFANIDNKATKETGETVNKPAFKACGYSGFEVLIDGEFVPLTAENCNVNGLPAKPIENGQGVSMTHSAGTTSSIMHILEALQTEEQFAELCELNAIIANSGITKFGQNKAKKIVEKEAIAANSEPETALPKAVLETFKVNDLRVYIGNLFPAIPAVALASMTKPNLLKCVV